MDLPHVVTARLKSFMLGELKLEEQEHAHIIRCGTCAKSMAESVMEIDTTMELNANMELNTNDEKERGGEKQKGKDASASLE